MTHKRSGKQRRRLQMMKERQEIQKHPVGGMDNGWGRGPVSEAALSAEREPPFDRPVKR